MDNSDVNASRDPFLDLKRYFEAIRIFNDFAKRINSGSVRNDGSDELLSIIDRCVLDSKENPFKNSIRAGKKLYRARIINPNELTQEKGFGLNDNDLVGFNETESREPPLGLGCSGRNNIQGVSYLYLSNKPSAACAEVKPGIRQLISLAEFEIVEPMRIVDFASNKRLDMYIECFSMKRLFTEIMAMYFLPVTDDDEYYATQFLTDYIRKTGVDGISYRSFYDTKGVNYTIFNSDHRRVKYCGSRIMLFQSESKTFLDINKKTVVNANSIGGKSFDLDSTFMIRNDIIAAISNNGKKND